MKKYSLLLVALLGMMHWSCSDDDPEEVIPTIKLTAPAPNATVDLESSQSVTFTWEAEGITDFTLMIGKTEDLSSPQTFAATGNSLEVTSAEMDAKAGELEIAQGATGIIYWSVKPTSATQKANLPKAIALNVVRIPAPVPKELLTPANGTAIALNYKSPDEQAVEFSWSDESGNTYELVIGKDAALSDVILSEPDIQTKTKTYTNTELQTLLIDSENLGLKKYLDNTLYWNVKVNGSYVSENPGVFTLSGYKIFVDTRHGVTLEDGETTETITYEVSVITYLDGTKGVWLAENLRTKMDINGVQLYDRDNCPEGAPLTIGYATPFQGDYPGTSGADPVPQANRDRAGVYYDLQKDLTVIIPAGWRLPVWDEFDKLYRAANAAEGGIAVLRDPACYPAESYPDHREQYNAWNMNMAANGKWKWILWRFEFDASFWYVYGDSPSHPNPDKKVVCFWGEIPAFDATNGDNTFGTNIRLVYDE